MMRVKAFVPGLCQWVFAMVLIPFPGAYAEEAITVKTWDFQDSTSGWQAVNDCRLTATREGLKIESSGADPHLVVPVSLPSGWNRISIEATCRGPVRGQVFWSTPSAGFSENQSAKFEELAGGKKLKRVKLDVFIRPSEATREVRLDPLDRAGEMWIHSMTVTQEEPPTQSATPVDEVRLADGFEIELIYNVPGDEQGSWVSLTSDDQNRLIASDQYGKLYRITPPTIDGSGELKVELLDVDMGMCQGLLCAFDSLYAVVNGNANQGAGLYRLRDTNGDDQYDEVKRLRRFDGGGEHGPHAVILSPDGKSLYVCGGNHTKLPAPEKSLVPRNWQEDQILPRMWDAGGHAVGIMAPGGWICRTDPEGKEWELVSSGFRNEYDIAFSPEGELFTYDADMEWDVGTPWYRPTRVNHVTSGSEFGWRSGTGKWPDFYPDSLSSVVDIGPGSPTGIVFGTGAAFPEKYQRALFISDWSYGIIYAVHMKEEGGSFVGEAEQFCSAAALQVSDMIVGPDDGALYFTIGGRRTQSGLYRVTYTGNESTEAAPPRALGETHDLRRKLEELHSQQSAEVVKEAWSHLSHPDRHVRFAARIALEHQPVNTWRQRLNTQENVEAIILSAIALARCGDPSDQPLVIESLARLEIGSLSTEQKLGLIRAYGLAMIRLGGPTETMKDAIIRQLGEAYPNSETRLNLELCRLLVAANDATAATKTMELLENAPTQEEQIHYALCLRSLEQGWNPDLRTRYFSWFNQAQSLRGGNSFSRFILNIRKEAMEQLDDETRVQLKEILEKQPEPADTLVDLKARPFVKNWTVQDLMAVADETSGDRDLGRGERVFATAQCFKCHRFQGRGGMVGPDLTAAGRRFNTQNLLESLVEPSKVISDQYQATLFVLDDGQQVAGRVVNLNGENYLVQSDMLNPGSLTAVNRQHVEEMAASAVSMMPEGLLDTFSQEEILDMLAYIRSGVQVEGDRPETDSD